jgi:hypothetical protein
MPPGYPTRKAQGLELSLDQLRALPQDRRYLWEWAKRRAGQCQNCGRIVPLGAAKTECWPYGDWSSFYVYYCDVCHGALFDVYGNPVSRYDTSLLGKG